MEDIRKDNCFKIEEAKNYIKKYDINNKKIAGFYPAIFYEKNMIGLVY